MSYARSKSLLVALFLTTACEPRDGDDDGMVVLTTSTGDMSTGNMSTVSTVTGVPTTTMPSTSSTTDMTGTDSDSDSDSTTSQTTTSSTTSPSVCGDGIVEGDEECDDGNLEDYDDCTNECRSPVCGDGIIYKGVEECDDGNDNDEDSCTSECKDAECGDGFQYLGFEECDDGNEINEDACTDECSTAMCGDGYVHDGVETCDDGNNKGNYGGCAPGCKAFGPHCGDGTVQKSEGERCDTNPPLASVTCNDNCTYNFANATQLYCAFNCTWDPVPGCQKGDADIFCKLKLGSPTAKAQSFNANTNVGSSTNGSGFPCANLGQAIPNDTRVNLGALPEFGVNFPVLWQNKDILSSHGNGDTIVNITCVDN